MLINVIAPCRVEILVFELEQVPEHVIELAAGFRFTSFNFDQLVVGVPLHAAALGRDLRRDDGGRLAAESASSIGVLLLELEHGSEDVVVLRVLHAWLTFSFCIVRHLLCGIVFGVVHRLLDEGERLRVVLDDDRAASLELLGGISRADAVRRVRRGDFNGLDVLREVQDVVQKILADRVGEALHLDDRGIAEVVGELLDLDGGAHEDDAQVRPQRQDVAEDHQQEVGVAVSLVHLVDDDVSQVLQQRVAQQSPDEDAGGAHQ